MWVPTMDGRGYLCPAGGREAGLLERPRGGHRGERVLAAKERVRTLVIRVDDEGFGQQVSVVRLRLGQTDHGFAQWATLKLEHTH